MSAEIILGLVILALLAYISWKEREVRLLNNKLINALLAKNANEMANLDLADKTKIEVEKPKQDDLVPPENLTDQEWKESIGLND